MDEEQRTGDPEGSQPGAREARDTGPATGTDGTDEQLSMQQLLEAEEASVREVRRGQVADGTVVRIDPDEVLVDIGLKSEGLIPGRELSSIEEELGHPLRVGDTILVYVVTTETPEGHALLSFRRAGTERFWRRAQQQVETGEVVEARVVEYNSGGLVVLYGTRAFVPISQLANVQRAGDSDEEKEQLAEQLRGMVGQTLKLKVIEADRKRNRLILSERQASRELRSQRRDQLLLELEAGQVRSGRVSNVASFGAFVDLGGADGLVHISELSWSRVKHPSEVVKPGQEVDVYVISVDRDTKKIALSLRRAQEDPWLTIEDRYPLGSIVFGQVIKQAQFGVFVRLDDGIEGLVHNSEIAPTDRRLLQEGSRLTFRVISIDLDRRRLRLSPAPEAMPEEDDFETPEEAQANEAQASAIAPDEAPDEAPAAELGAEPQPEPTAEPPAQPESEPGAAPQASAEAPSEGEAPPQAGPGPEPASESNPEPNGATGVAGEALQSTAGSPAGAAPAPGRRSDDAA